MLATITSGAVVGLDAQPVEVEVDIASQGFPAFSIVGLGDKAIQEAKERVRAAIGNSQTKFPDRRITVNLSPADLPKQGPAYDFPISVGILIASEFLPPIDLKEVVFLGELSLDGSLRHTPGVLSLVLMAKEHGFSQVFLPAIDAPEASVVEGIEIIPVSHLLSFISHMQGVSCISPYIRDEKTEPSQAFAYDFSDVIGQEHAKRALTIAAAGGHNVAMTGPAGSGKTLLARTLPSILPPMVTSEALEVTKVASVTGTLPPGKSLLTQRPFRAPHHTVSRVGLIGGGTHPIPGEISMAHRGVLFLDEFPEFPRHVLEALRQPIEDGIVAISRARMSVIFPANFMLVTAQNPCPCGNYGEADRECSCSPHHILRYHKKVSGPMMDRIDLHVHVPAVDVEKLTTVISASGPPESSESATLREQVTTAREVQVKRFNKITLACNADMNAKMVKRFCVLNEECRDILRVATQQLSLSARSYHKVVKLARTIADLAGEEEISTLHISEALQYRLKESM